MTLVRNSEEFLRDKNILTRKWITLGYSYPGTFFFFSFPFLLFPFPFFLGIVNKINFRHSWLLSTHNFPSLLLCLFFLNAILTSLTNIISTHQTIFSFIQNLLQKSVFSRMHIKRHLPESEIQKLVKRFLALPKKQRVYMKKMYEQTFATWLKKGRFSIFWFPLECNHSKNMIFILLTTEFSTKSVFGTW